VAAVLVTSNNTLERTVNHGGRIVLAIAIRDERSPKPDALLHRKARYRLSRERLTGAAVASR